VNEPKLLQLFFNSWSPAREDFRSSTIGVRRFLRVQTKTPSRFLSRGGSLNSESFRELRACPERRRTGQSPLPTKPIHTPNKSAPPVRRLLPCPRDPCFPVIWFSASVRKRNDPNSLRHIEVVNDEWKTTHEIMPGAVFAQGPPIRRPSDSLQRLLCSPLEIQPQARLSLLIKSYRTQPAQVPPLPR
jgi:hypothetical protein